jgi:putative nucleotidyltransferase with HDIG domain
MTTGPSATEERDPGTGGSRWTGVLAEMSVHSAGSGRHRPHSRGRVLAGVSIEPRLDQQQVLEETLHRRQARLTSREELWAGLSWTGFIAAVGGLWWIDPPGPFAIVPALVCMLVLALSVNVRFDTPLGYAATIQLAFVPLVFALPPALVPIAVTVAFALSLVPELIRGRVRPSRLALQASNAWFSIGPAAVFAIAHVPAWQAGAGLLVTALAAQFLVDFAVSSLGFLIARGASLSSQLGEAWVYVVDGALSPAALLAAESIHRTALAALALVPLLGLISVLAHERHKRLEGVLELSNTYRGTALVLGDVVEADDGYTGQHCKSVVGLALAVASELGLEPERRRNLEFAALLHDVGKISIPKEIINKPGELEAHEWTVIKTHTREGQRMLARVGGFMRDVGQIVCSHHERWDGTGYPDGLAGEEIPLEARIVSCCDTWNAMRTDRPYRKALTYDVAVAELIAVSGAQLDPQIVQSLLQIVAIEAAAERVSPDADGAPQPQLEYGYARPAC